MQATGYASYVRFLWWSGWQQGLQQPGNPDLPGISVIDHREGRPT
jgi:hypothetical protein